MKKVFSAVLITAFVLLGVLSCAKKETVSTGLVYDEASYAKVAKKAQLVTRAYDFLPSSSDLQWYTPTPGDQGDFGTCVSWATTYCAMTMCNTIINGNERIFSPYYLYRSCNPSDRTGEGMCIEDGLRFLQANGVPMRINKEKSIPYDEFELDLYEDAPLYKIGNFARLIEWNDDPAYKIQRIKKSLSEKKPVVIGFHNYPKSFHTAKNSSDWYPDGRHTQGGHAMVIVAYDDNHINPSGKRNGAFLFQNSWGTNWGRNGYIWVNYDDAAEYILRAFEISPSILQVYSPPEIEPEPIPEPQPKPIPQPKPVIKKVQVFKGNFELPLWGKKGSMEVTYKNGCYETSESYGYPTRFQLFMTNKTPCYVYAFASDSSTGKTNIIFPPKNTSALLDYTENTVAYPSEDTSIQLDTTPGTDYLIVLYSLEEIDITGIMKEWEKQYVMNINGNFDLYSAVKDSVDKKELIPLSAVNFQKNKIDFSVVQEAPSTNKILPVILKIKHK